MGGELERAPQRREIGSVLRQEKKGPVVQRNPEIACIADVDGSEVTQERRCDDALDGRQRTNRFPRIAWSADVASNGRVDRLHTPHRSDPLATDGESTAEVAQLEHRENSLQCVSVDAHRRGDVRGGLRGGLSPLSSSSRARMRVCLRACDPTFPELAVPFDWFIVASVEGCRCAIAHSAASLRRLQSALLSQRRSRAARRDRRARHKRETAGG